MTASVTPVRKVVIPAAGLGTRFLPATKILPKEMLPVVDKPAIQYVVEEAVQAGLTDILIITGRNKRAIEDHFDRNFELEHYLEGRGQLELLKEVQFASDLADMHYVRQRDPLGLGHAISVARHHVGREPFVVMLADELMVDDGALLRSMLGAHATNGNSVVAVTEVAPEEISSYGCVEPATTAPESFFEIRRIVEKPPRDVAPSNLAVTGRYVFSPEIFDMLDRIEPGRGGELQLTDAIALLLEEQTVLGYQCTHGRFDVGQKLDFLRANIELALDHEDLGPELGPWLRDLVVRRGLA
jgi:UTP--glucose-1-phosphate uridylyltransferase